MNRWKVWPSENLEHISMIHALRLQEGFRFSSKDFQPIFWSWFVDFTDYALECFRYLCNSIFSTFVGVSHTRGEVIYAPLMGVCITPTVYV